jgi:N-acetylglucosamine-6-sulfatase
LRDTGELDNTIIIYTGDQGFFLGEHDLMDKRWVYEEAMRMPFIVHCSKLIKAGSSNDWLINNTDFAPTILALAGVAAPDQMQGRSFASALRGEPRPTDWRTATYYRYWMHMAHNLRVPAHFGIRTERHKLIFFYGCTPSGKVKTPAAWELYDLKTDASEMHNQYANPEYAEVVADLKRQLRETRAALKETDENYPHVQAVIDAHTGTPR